MVGLVWGGGHPPIQLQIRGDMEDRLKKVKQLAKKRGIRFTGDTSKGHFSGLVSGSYTANAAWLQLNSLAHNLCRYTNQLITTRHLTTKTLRYRYLTLPGRITTGSRTTTLHLPAQWPWRRKGASSPA